MEVGSKLWQAQRPRLCSWLIGRRCWQLYNLTGGRHWIERRGKEENPASPFISATSDPAIARFFAGPNGVVHTLSVPTNRAIFNTFNNYVIPGIGREAEYLIPNYIRPSEFIR